MKKLFLFIFFLFGLNSGIFSQSCLPEGITFSDQSQIDNFQINYPNCTDIEGDVKIFGPLINNLNGLFNLTSIEGDLLIGKDSVQTTALTSLSGLDNLKSVGGNLSIYNQANLLILAGLESLSSVGKSFSIDKATSLELLTGLENLNVVGEMLRISGNDKLVGIESLINLISVGEGIMISSNDSLINLQGLNNISTPNIELTIFDNDNLINLEGFSSLTTLGALNIAHNDQLLSLGGLSNVTSVTDIRINSNIELLNLSDLKNIESVGEYIGITSNASLINLDGINLPVINDIYIYDNDELLDLSGLENITTIQGHLYVSDNNNMTSLSGLENVTEIGDYLWLLFNRSLTNLLGLSNVNSVGGSIQIRMDSSLTSLAGIDNIEPESITSLSVRQNPLLSYCEVKSVCDYLALPDANINIANNAPGCNNVNEVEEACDSAFCLPEGIAFSTQSDIDQFQAMYPDCSVIEGNVTINGNEIQDLSFLNKINSIGGNLVIADNEVLTTLNGFENLISITGDLVIGSEDKGGNPSLIDLTALSNLRFLGGNLAIRQNNNLSSLAGLENIQSNSLDGVIIIDNPKLSVCNLENICEYIHSPQGNSEIRNNAQGCTSTSEVMELCENWIPGWNSNRFFNVFPNPAKNIIKISTYNGRSKIKEITIYNSIGQKALHTTDISDELNVSKLNQGFYVIEIVTEDFRGRLKLVIEK